jgi:hypothetical protein
MPLFDKLSVNQILVFSETVSKSSYREFLTNLSTSKKPKETIKEFVIKYFIRAETPFSGFLNEFLSKFNRTNGRYEFAPSVLERLKYSGLRNFLIDLGLIYLDSDAKNTLRLMIITRYLLN